MTVSSRSGGSLSLVAGTTLKAYTAGSYGSAGQFLGSDGGSGLVWATPSGSGGGSVGPTGATGISGGITLAVTNLGSGAYVINGSNNPTLSFIRGHRYVINVSTPGHPFWIQTVSGAYSSGNVYSSGITNNGTESGTIIFEVPFNAPQLYYVCQNHSSMAGSITVSNLGPIGPTGATGADSTVPGPTGATGADSTVPGPTGATGADSTVPGPTGATGADSTVPGPTGATGADSTVPGPTGATGADSTVPGPTGATGADSTVPGPTGATGADSTVPGPTGATGADSTVPGPTGATGADSTVPGPTGATGPAGTNGTSTGEVLFMDIGALTPQSTPVSTGTLTKSAILGTQVVLTHAASNTPNYLMTSLLTPVGALTSSLILPGFWDMNLYAINSSSTVGSITYYFSVEEVQEDGVTTVGVIATGTSESATPVLQTQTVHIYSLYVPSYQLATLSSRIKVDVYANFSSGGSKTLTIEFRDNTISHVHTTLFVTSSPAFTGPTGAILYYDGSAVTGTTGLVYDGLSTITNQASGNYINLNSDGGAPALTSGDMVIHSNTGASIVLSNLTNLYLNNAALDLGQFGLIRDTVASTGIMGQVLTVDPNSYPIWQNLPSSGSTGPAGSIQLSNGSGGMDGSTGFYYDISTDTLYGGPTGNSIRFDDKADNMTITTLGSLSLIAGTTFEVSTAGSYGIQGQFLASDGNGCVVWTNPLAGLATLGNTGSTGYWINIPSPPPITQNAVVHCKLPILLIGLYQLLRFFQVLLMEINILKLFLKLPFLTRTQLLHGQYLL
jgi:hypothetical protein